MTYLNSRVGEASKQRLSVMVHHGHVGDIQQLEVLRSYKPWSMYTEADMVDSAVPTNGS